MSNTFFVYRFINAYKQVIYVGKTKESLQKRFLNHKHLPDACYQSVKKIEYIRCKSESDMDIKEIYYINKYSHENHITYNLLDVTAPSEDIDFNDNWICYKSFLPEWFSSSINVIYGYKETKKIKYNKDGSIKKTAPHRKKGVSYDVFPLDENEVKMIIMRFIERINHATNNSVQQQQLRNLIIFMTGIQYPIKINALLRLKYSDVFNYFDKVKILEYKTNRSFKDYTFKFDLDNTLKEIYYIYRKKYNLSFANNSEDYLFLSREKKVLSVSSINYILKEITRELDINKNVGGETLRKTYGLHIYNRCSDKIRALDYLELIFGQKGLGEIAKYLGIIEKDFDYNSFLSEEYNYLQTDVLSYLW